jgi:ABC-type glycerol-3-phosphate transport system substrate-binding protein
VSIRSLISYIGAFAVAMIPLFAQPVLAQKIELWSNIDTGTQNANERAMAKIIDTFKVSNPGIDVVITIMPWQQLSPTLLRASKAGQVPDLVMLFSPLVPMHIAAGTLRPLQPYLDTWSADARSDLVRLSQNFDRKGTTFAIPWQMRVSGLMYREDLLKAAGKSPPQSLDELAETAKALAKDGTVGIALGFSPEAPSVAAGWFLTTLVGSGAKVLNDDGTAAFVSPQAERLVKWVQDLVVNGKDALPQNVALQGQEQAFNLFTAQKSVFFPMSSDRLENIRLQSKLGKAIKMVSYPGFDKGKPSPALVQSWNLVIPNGAKQSAAAWKFIEHASSATVQAELAKIAGYIPVRKSSLKDPWFQDEQAENIRWAMNYAATNPLNFNFPVNTEALYEIWAQMFGQVLTGRTAPRAALAWAESEYNRRAGR